MEKLYPNEHKSRLSMKLDLLLKKAQETHMSHCRHLSLLLSIGNTALETGKEDILDSLCNHVINLANAESARVTMVEAYGTARSQNRISTTGGG